jgi:hypothetical protein
VQTTDQPIGFWVKHLDNRIDAAMDRSLSTHALTRRGWQALNVLAGGPVAERELSDSLAPFWRDGDQTLEQVTGGLQRRGWLDRAPDGRWSLTDAGRAAHAAAAASVHADRAAAMRGIDEGDYRTAIRVLRMMSDNLAG